MTHRHRAHLFAVLALGWGAACAEPAQYETPGMQSSGGSSGTNRDGSPDGKSTPVTTQDASPDLDQPAGTDGPTPDVSAETSIDLVPVDQQPRDVPPADTMPDQPPAPPDLGTPIDAVVLFDEAHEVWPTTTGTWSRLAADLVADGHSIRTHKTGQLVPGVLAGANVLVIGTSWGAFSAGELQAIDDFVKKGGGLFITGLGWSWVNPQMSRTLDNYPMNQVGRLFGITFLDGWIQDPTNFDMDKGKAVFTVTGNHPITAGIRRLGGGMICSPLRVMAAGAELVVRGDQDATDLNGYYPAGQQPPLIAAVKHGQGRVVAVGHEGYFETGDGDSDGVANIDEYDNRLLGRNIIQFLAGYR